MYVDANSPSHIPPRTLFPKNVAMLPCVAAPFDTSIDANPHCTILHATGNPTYPVDDVPREICGRHQEERLRGNRVRKLTDLQ